MTGYVDDIINKYNIIISWKGGNQVNYIKADKLTISSTSFLNPKTYWSKSISVSGGSTKNGSRVVGSVIIDGRVKKVKIKSSGLRCYFNNRDYWIRLNEINGNLSL